MSDAENKVDEWIITRCELLSFQLSVDYVAVFADVAEDGFSDLHSSPVDAIGLAEVTSTTYRGVRGHPNPRAVYAVTTRELVGVELADGYWVIANEAHNFAGLARAGDDISGATGCLNPEYEVREKVSPQNSLPTT